MTSIKTIFIVLSACASITVAKSTQELSATVGGETNITCLFEDGTLRNIYWYFNTAQSWQRILTLAKGDLTVAPPYIGRATLQNDNNTLSLKGITVADEGTYRCDVDRQGQPALLHIYSDLNIYTLRPSTLPVVSPCAMIGESTLCTTQANDTYSLTCTLFNVYPVKEAVLTWYQDGKSVSSSYGETFNSDVITNLSLRIEVTQSRNLTCNASFVSAEGRQHTAVSVEAWILPLSVMTDEADPKNETLNGGIIAVIVVCPLILLVAIVAIGVMIIKFRRRKQNKDAGTVEDIQSKTGARSEPVAKRKLYDDIMLEDRERHPLISVSGNTNQDKGSEIVMEDVLTDKLLSKLSDEINPTTVTPEMLSIFLGFSAAQGSMAVVTGNIAQIPSKAYNILFAKYVMKHGRKEEGALKLIKLFTDNDMKLLAEIVKDAMTAAAMAPTTSTVAFTSPSPSTGTSRVASASTPPSTASVACTSIYPCITTITSNVTSTSPSTAPTASVTSTFPSTAPTASVTSTSPSTAPPAPVTSTSPSTASTASVTSSPFSPSADGVSGATPAERKRQTQLTTMTEGLTEEKLIKVADAVAVDENLLNLGLKLEFKVPKVQTYISSNKRNDSSEGTRSMLLAWKKKTPKAKQIPDLIEALNESGFAELVDDFFPSGHAGVVTREIDAGNPSTAASNAGNALVSTTTTNTPGAMSTYAGNDYNKIMSSKENPDFDEILKQIAQELHTETEIDNLGKALEFNPADIGRYINANEKQGGNSMGTLNMLRTWRKMQTLSTERGILRSALVKAKLAFLADKYLSTPEKATTAAALAPTTSTVAFPSLSPSTGTDATIAYCSTFPSSATTASVTSSSTFPSSATIASDFSSSTYPSLFTTVSVTSTSTFPSTPSAGHVPAATSAEINNVSTTTTNKLRAMAASADKDYHASIQVPESKLQRLADELPNTKYAALCRELGENFNKSENRLVQHNKDYPKAVMGALMEWKNETGGYKVDLQQILKDSKVGGLAYILE